jgi:hypothetical protein
MYEKESRLVIPRRVVEPRELASSGGVTGALPRTSQSGHGSTQVNEENIIDHVLAPIWRNETLDAAFVPATRWSLCDRVSLQPTAGPRQATASNMLT